MKTRRILMLIFGIIALAINIFIVIEGCIGVDESARESIGFTESLIKFVEDINPSSHIGDDPEKTHAVIRKLFGHFLLFGLSGIFTTLTFIMLDDAIVSRKLEIILSCLSVGLTVSILSELVQFFAPGRYGLFIDMVIDFAGFISFFAIVFLIAYLIYRRKGNKVA